MNHASITSLHFVMRRPPLHRRGNPKILFPGIGISLQIPLLRRGAPLVPSEVEAPGRGGDASELPNSPNPTYPSHPVKFFFALAAR